MPLEPTSHHDLRDKSSAFHAAEAREQFAREYMVAVETMNLVRYCVRCQGWGCDGSDLCICDHATD